MKLTPQQIDLLNKKLPDWALKEHPTKKYLTVINPMAVIDRLNEVFGVGQWQIESEPVNFVGKFAVVKTKFTVPEFDIHIEQFGGNDNSDVGDAYKGAATDALTKISSYLGIGASIYKGQGNVEKLSDTEYEKATQALELATSKEELTEAWKSLGEKEKADTKLKEFAKKLASKLE